MSFIHKYGLTWFDNIKSKSAIDYPEFVKYE
jgi:hypothetical protein